MARPVAHGTPLDGRESHTLYGWATSSGYPTRHTLTWGPKVRQRTRKFTVGVIQQELPTEESSPVRAERRSIVLITRGQTLPWGLTERSDVGREARNRPSSRNGVAISTDLIEDSSQLSAEEDVSNPPKCYLIAYCKAAYEQRTGTGDT